MNTTSRLEVRMRRWSILLVPAAVLLTLAAANPAFAQFGPGGGMRPGGQPQGNPSQMGPEEKEEGPAESAPEQKAENPALQPLPAWPQQREKTAPVLRAPRLHPLPRLPVPRAEHGHLAGPDGSAGALHHPLLPSSARTAMSANADEPRRRAARSATSRTAAPTTYLGRHAPAPRADRERHRAGARQGAARRVRQPGHGLDARGLLP